MEYLADSDSVKQLHFVLEPVAVVSNGGLSAMLVQLVTWYSTCLASSGVKGSSPASSIFFSFLLQCVERTDCYNLYSNFQKKSRRGLCLKYVARKCSFRKDTLVCHM